MENKIDQYHADENLKGNCHAYKLDLYRCSLAFGDFGTDKLLLLLFFKFAKVSNQGDIKDTFIRQLLSLTINQSLPSISS